MYKELEIEIEIERCKRSVNVISAEERSEEAQK